VRMDKTYSMRVIKQLMRRGNENAIEAVIVEVIGNYYGYTEGELFGRSRQQPLATARMLAMSLIYEQGGMSFPCIGDMFSRDHTTAVHAITRIHELIELEPKFGKEVEMLRTRVKEETNRYLKVLSNVEN